MDTALVRPTFDKDAAGRMSFREDLHTALKGMVDEGLISANQALSTAEQILKGNAKAVYGI